MSGGLVGPKTMAQQVVVIATFLAGVAPRPIATVFTCSPELAALMVPTHSESQLMAMSLGPLGLKAVQ